MSIKRSFTVKITFKEGYGDPITLTGKDATAFNTAWHNKLNDQDGAIGFGGHSGDDLFVYSGTYVVRQRDFPFAGSCLYFAA